MKAATKKHAPSPRSKSRAPSPPAFAPVQLATLVSEVPKGEGWLHEIKYDGYRCLLAVGGGASRAYTRSGLDWSERFAAVAAAGAKLAVTDALIDGEVVILDDKGRSSFQALQGALKSGRKDLVFFAFDLLRLDGEDLRRLPQRARKERLARLLSRRTGVIRYSEHIEGHGEKLIARFCAEGLEGVVSKRADAPYLGERTTSWLKTKCLQRQEFVIVGWTQSDKRRGFRSLILATRVKGALRFAGKVGAGFDMDEIARLSKRMAPLAQATPAVDAPRAAVKGAQWIKPVLVAEIAYAEMTADGVLRHPSYLGLREDKGAGEVVLEKAKPPPRRTTSKKS